MFGNFKTNAILVIKLVLTAHLSIILMHISRKRFRLMNNADIVTKMTYLIIGKEFAHPVIRKRNTLTVENITREIALIVH